MKREIYCEPCYSSVAEHARKALSRAVKNRDELAVIELASEQLKGEHGALIRPALCDRCNSELPKGMSAVAATFVTDGRYSPWEHEYIHTENKTGANG